MRQDQRKHPAHLASIERPNQSIIQFVTVCTDKRKKCLCKETHHQLLRDIWTDDSVYRVGRYVIMPDHIHLFCAPNTETIEPLARWVRYWKGNAASRWSERVAGKLWQRDFWDRQLRAHESYSGKWDYMQNNPVRAGLTKASKDWPYQGEIYQLSWHD